jgi:Tol biopolymer transport system component
MDPMGLRSRGRIAALVTISAGANVLTRGHALAQAAPPVRAGCMRLLQGILGLFIAAVISGPNAAPTNPRGRPTMGRATSSSASNAYPDWSPDGHRIAFESDRTGNAEIYVMNADGSKQQRLTRNPGCDTVPAWSPNGKKIAFASARTGKLQIYVMNPDGSKQQRVTQGAANNYLPRWAPDGRRIAFESDRSGTSQIYVMNADGSDQHPLTRHRASASPGWSPNGKKIAFASDRTGNAEIYVMNADGSDQHRLTRNQAHDDDPTWSPDGRRIAFDSDRSGKSQIYIMNADGSNQHRLTRSQANDGDSAWSPNGKEIVFDSDRGGKSQIYIMNADGSNQHRLTARTASGEVAFAQKWAKDEGFSDNAQAVAGAKVFAATGCLSCHTYLGAGSSNLGAPDLSREGRRHRGRAWQIAHLKCPACLVAGSPMPSLTGLGAANLHALAVFLEASKGRIGR